MDYLEWFYQRISELRIQKGVSARDMSLSLGQSESYINKIENKRTLPLNCTPFVRQYDILSNKWGVLLCQREYQTNDIRRNSKNW